MMLRVTGIAVSFLFICGAQIIPTHSSNENYIQCKKRLTFDLALYEHDPCGLGGCPYSIRRVPAFTVTIRPDKPNSIQNQRYSDLATSSLKSGFAFAAGKALSEYTDDLAEGWSDEADTICRSHRRKPSIVLPRPYFEDVDYCARLLPFTTRSDGIADLPVRQFNIQIQISVDISKNPNSGYREPDRDEIAHYDDAARKMSNNMMRITADKLREDGWILEEGSLGWGDTGVLIVGPGSVH
jgi:hypothetical protein